MNIRQTETPRADTQEGDAEVIARLMRGRFSCRSFRPDPVPDAVLLRIIGTMRWTASWSIIQPWDDTIITKSDITAQPCQRMRGATLHRGITP